MAKQFRLTPAHKSLMYLVLACAAIMLFYFVVPVGSQPVKPFVSTWRLLRGALAIADYFPALALSAFIIPFGCRVKSAEDKIFIPGSAASLTASVVRAIIASCVYGLLLFFVVPLANDTVENMRARTALYTKSHAAIRVLLFRGGSLAPGALTDSELSQARQLLAVCEYIWPSADVISAEREEILSETEDRKLRVDGGEAVKDSPASRSFSGQRQPVNAVEALRFATTAMDEKRYYDAHWLAGLAGRLAPVGSVERNAATRLAAQAWAMVEQFEPSDEDIRAHDHYRIKRDGYEAMIAEDWIRAYYIILELQLLTPNDPDLPKFKAKCEEGIQSIAFFTDEVVMTSPYLRQDAVFSVPRIEAGGRLVFRAESLSTFSDTAYALNVEILGFDASRRPLYRVSAPYARIVPVTIGEQAKSVVYMRALDRHNKNLRWEPVWEGRHEAAADNAGLVMDIAYEDILTINEANTGGTDYRFLNLYAAGARLANYGFVPEVFTVLEIRSISEPLMLLPLSILAIITGWRYRVRTRRARYAFFPMLAALPLVLNALVRLCRHLNNSFAVWAALTVSLPVSIALSAAAIALLFIISIIILAYQKEPSGSVD